jgi:phosphatidate cytidylyltransferase
MIKRTITSLVMFAVGFPLLLIGGVPYFLFIGFLIISASKEYLDMMKAVDVLSSRVIVLSSVLLVILTRTFAPQWADTVFTLSILLLMAYHLAQYELGREKSALDFSVSVSNVVYLGWVGSYLITLRNLPNGGWWLMVVLMCVWLNDTGAYMIGSAYGKHKMSPRLSPKKSWEGFYAGVFSSMLVGGYLAFAFTKWGPLQLEIWQGALLGLAIGVLTPLGDLGVSMIKRMAGFKDSGGLIPGHGGAFDRIDSWIWGGVLGFLIISGFLI